MINWINIYCHLIDLKLKQINLINEINKCFEWRSRLLFGPNELDRCLLVLWFQTVHCD
jgi:hypothetical protein